MEKDNGFQNDSAVLEVVDGEPTPEFSAMVADELRWLFDLINDDNLRALGRRQMNDPSGRPLVGTLRRIALLKMESCTNREIAEQLGVTLRNVERGWALLRVLWQAKSSHVKGL